MTPYIVKDISHFCNVSLDKCSVINKKMIAYYDLTFVLSGSMTYIANGEKYVLNANDAILLPPKTLRQRFEGTQKVSYVSFNFQIDPKADIPLPHFLPNVITQDIRKIVDVFSQKHLSPLYHSKEKLCNILNYIIFELIDSVSLKSNHPDVVKIEKFIDENIYKKITLNMISQEVHLSMEYVSYLFKKNVGKTVIEYVNEKKMLLAKNIIQTEGLSLKELAESLGYENYGYFSRIFKKHFNTSPMQYKKHNK